MKDIGKQGSVNEGGQKKASRLDHMAAGGDTGALELVVVLVPDFGDAGLVLHLAVGLEGVEVLDLAIALSPRPAPLGRLLLLLLVILGGLSSQGASCA